MKHSIIRLSIGLAAAVLAVLSLGQPGIPVAPAEAQEAVILYGMAADNSQGSGDGGTGNNGTAMSSLYRIDPATGAATLVGATGYRGISGMDFHPDTGVLYAVGRRASDDRAYLLIINPATGKATEIGEINNEDFQRVPDMSFRNSDNKLFAWDEDVDRLATIDISTGEMTTFGVNVGCAGHGMAFSPSDVLYLADCLDFVSLNTTTGTPTLIGELAPMPTPDHDGSSAMDFHPLSGKLYAAITALSPEPRERYLATIDPTTAEVTILGVSVNGLDALAFQVTQSERNEREDRPRTNVAGALGGIVNGSAATQANLDRAAANAAPAPTAVAPNAGTLIITPPSTGDAGLASTQSQTLYGVLATVVGLIGLSALRFVRR